MCLQYGDTSLLTAVRYGRPGVVRILLAVQANLAARNANLDTALHIAAALKRTKILRNLLEHPMTADASANNSSSHTSEGSTSSSSAGTFMAALVRRNRPGAASTSFQAVAKKTEILFARNAQSEMPVDVAKRKGHNEVSAFLVAKMNEWSRWLYENDGANAHLSGGRTILSSPTCPDFGSALMTMPMMASVAKEAEPYMSHDIVFTAEPMSTPQMQHKKRGAFKFSLKVSNITWNGIAVGDLGADGKKRFIH